MSDPLFVTARPVLVRQPRVRVPLRPGDRIVVHAGESVVAGDLLAERVRDPRLVETGGGSALSRPGAWVPAEPGRRGTAPAGELLFQHAGRRRIATGPHPDLVAAPAAGRVVAIHPGVELVLQLDGTGIPGAELLGDPGHGRLAILPGDGDGRIPLEVAHAGAIIAFPGRADAESLTRARAMGIAGAIVPALSERDRRDVVASEGRQRAGLHRLPPFPVLILDGYLRRSLAGPVRAILAALAGSEVGLVGGPPMLMTALAPDDLPPPDPDRVRVRGGPEVGREGRFAGLTGPRRLPGGIMVETARIHLDDGREVVVALGDLERFI
ncbi:MAG: hypothetical protein ABIG85_02570 [Chloroflexota bacterium]